MKKELIKFYKGLHKTINNNYDDSVSIDYNFIDGAYVLLKNARDGKYKVDFIDKVNDNVIFSTELSNNMWARSSIKYYVNYKIIITNLSNNKIIFEHDTSLKDKKVFINFESKSLGDTLAWFPHVERFRKKHQCKLVVSTFLNDLFKSSYPNIKFVEPGTHVSNIYAKYDIGWFWNNETDIDLYRNPQDCRLLPLGQTASDILGLDYKEVKPILDIPYKPSNFKNKYVCIATQSTAQAKYWNKIGGWDKIVSYLNSKGYDVVDIDKYHTFGVGDTMNSIPNGVIDKTGEISLTDRIVDLQHAEFFIGLGSGLSWLSWAVGTPTILISSFSKPFGEFEQCVRVYKDTPNSGFFNDSQFRLDASNWNWNPIQECNTLDDWDKFEPIEIQDVMDAVNDMIEGINYPHKVIDDIGQEYDPTQIRSFSPHALVVNSTSIGDTISVTPTLRKLKKVVRKKIDVYTHRTELFFNNPNVEGVYHIDELNESNYNKTNIHKTFINVGQKINGIEKKHNIFDIRQFHATDLGFMLTSDEMSCDFFPSDVDTNITESLPNKYIVVHPTKTWDSRSWSQDRWQRLINLLIKDGNVIVAVGKTDSENGFWGKLDKEVLNLNQNKNYIDLMNKTNISTTWSVLNNSDYVITMDSGILHLAGTTNTNIIQIGSSIDYKFRAPYRQGNQQYKYKYIKGGCDFCASDMKYSIKEWKEIQSVAPVVDCLDKRYSNKQFDDKDKFKDCHPTADQVFNGFKNIIDDSDQMDLDFKPTLEVEDEIYVEFDSRALGDNLAWIPYVEEFRKQKKCKVVVSTYWNKLYDTEYPNLNFISPDTYDGNPKEKYRVALLTEDDWMDEDYELKNWDNKDDGIDYRTVPLQQAASNALGMKHKEIKTKVKVPNKKRLIKGKYVTLSIQSTAQAKYWNYPMGWKMVVDHLKRKGFKVVAIDMHEVFGIEGHWNKVPPNVINKLGCSIEDAMVLLRDAEFHLGISSGLSWLSWAVGTPTLMISGFTKPYTEFQSNIVRLFDDSDCNGCYNDKLCSLPRDEGWLWCPRDKNFICSKKIKPVDVFKAIGQIRRIKK